MGDDIVRKAVKEVIRHDLMGSVVNHLLSKLNIEELSNVRKEIEKLFYNKIEWLEEPEGYFYSFCYKPCECVDINGCGKEGCETCDADGIVWDDDWDVKDFEEAVKNTGGLAINISSEHLQISNDWDMSKTFKLIFESNPLFTKYVNIEPQWTRYLLVWPAPKELVK